MEGDMGDGRWIWIVKIIYEQEKVFLTA